MPEEIQGYRTRAAIVPSSYDKEAGTIEVVFATEAAVRTIDRQSWTRINEVLVCEESAVDMTRVKNGAPFLKDHRNATDNVLGVCEDGWVKDGKCYAKIRLSKNPIHQGTINDLVDGIHKNISAGYQVGTYEKIESTNGEIPTWRATAWEVLEVSLIPVQADKDSQVRMPQEEKMEDTTKNTDVVETKVETPAVDTRAAQQAEQTRILDITDAAQRAGLPETEIRKMIVDGVTIDQARKVILDKVLAEDKGVRGANIDASVKTDEREHSRRGMEIAISLRSGEVVETDLSRDEIALAQKYRHTKLIRVAEDSLLQSGLSLAGIRDLGDEEVAKRAIMSSTSDFPVILEAVVNRVLKKQYDVASLTWREFCSTGSATNFLENRQIRTGSFDTLDEVSENAEFKTKAIPDGEYEKYSVKTKGNLINLSRQAIINDDLGAFTRLAGQLARAAARSIEKDVYALLAQNSGNGPTMQDGKTLFHADHGNLYGTTGLTVATLSGMRQLMMKQMDPSGNDYLDVMPSIGLFPAALAEEANVLVNSQYDTNVSNKFQVPNKVRGIVEKIVSTQRISGDTQYYLFAKPSQHDVIQVTFLNGVQTPFTDRQEGFAVDGIQWKIRLDYGVGAVGWRGAVTNKNA